MNFDRVKGREKQAQARKRRAGRLDWSGAPGPERLEARTLLSLTYTSFPIPLVTAVRPQGIAKGSDGNLWFTEAANNQIGEITPAGKLTQFPLPKEVDSPAYIVAGSDGNLWFTANDTSKKEGVVARITTTGVVSTFAIPSKPASLYGITAGPGGGVWFTESNDMIGRVSPSGVVTEFAGPPGAIYPDSPSAITTGPDGALWFVSGGPVSANGPFFSPDGTISRMTTAGSLTTYQVANLSNGINGRGEAGITTGPDGALWFTGFSNRYTGTGVVGRITTTGVVTQFPTPNFNPTDITLGADGNLWLGEASSPRIGRITPRGTFTSFSVSSPFYNVGGLTLGPEGNVWFTANENATPGEQAGVGYISPAGVATFHAIPPKFTFSPFPGIPVFPTSITTGPDKALWFAETNQIGRISTKGKFTQFSLPNGVTPAQILSGPENSLWWFTTISEAASWGFASQTDIGRITTRGAVTETPLPANINAITAMAKSSDGSLWFSDQTVSGLVELRRINPNGQISTAYSLFPAGSKFGYISAIANGPDGNIWFAGSYQPNNEHTPIDVLGEVSAGGNTRLITLSTPTSSDFAQAPPNQLITGPDGRLWFTEQSGTSTEIVRISTSGKYASPIPLGQVYVSLLSQGTEGRVWFLERGNVQGTPANLVAATGNGILASYPLPPSNPRFPGGIGGMTIGPDGKLWLTDHISVINKGTGLDTVAGGLDYRNRPNDAVDFNASSQSWTNSTSANRPTFAGLARPGADVTLYAQREGAKAITMIGRVKADPKDGSWTLNIHQFLSYGTYAITAKESGEPGQTSTLYSLTPDASGNLSNALIIKPK